MGNAMACFYPGAAMKSRSTCPLEHSERSLKSLQRLKSNSMARRRGRGRPSLPSSLKPSSPNQIVPVSQGEEGDSSCILEREGAARVKLVLTKKEAALLLSVLSGGREHELGFEGSGSLGWTPSLQSIPEGENCCDELEFD
ncbi:hypothetical protein AXF42_Ash007168 [Apostasia shenzhenica]|uniref:Uncharacterized protein n=1 Tax=Apostasia shenzhenica TaxID=1088818 RepID=A0A2I0B9E8_9ASPA|nr:hypothetical protein AXF42_Ash007168 [Apostasia shenzhenica]